MSRTSLLRFAVAVTLFAGLGAGASGVSRSTQPSDNEKRLGENIADLQRENARLKDQVRELQARLALANQLKFVPSPDRAPDHWKPQEFNGMTFYLVPLDAERPFTIQPTHR